MNGQCDPYATVTLAGPSRQVLHIQELPFYKESNQVPDSFVCWKSAFSDGQMGVLRHH